MMRQCGGFEQVMRQAAAKGDIGAFSHTLSCARELDSPRQNLPIHSEEAAVVFQRHAIDEIDHCAN